MDQSTTSKHSHFSPLCELGNRLYWKPATEIIFVLWGYFDESGEHDYTTGHPVRMTVAGCIAPFESWLRFENEWRGILSRYGIQEFHAQEFASRKSGFRSQYKGWGQEKRTEFLNELLRPMTEHIHYFTAAKVVYDQATPQYRNSYAAGVLKTISWACSVAQLNYEDDISLAFAEHPELPGFELCSYARQLRENIPNLGDIINKKPVNCPPLQAADLFAYEYSHCQDWNDLQKLNPVLTKLRSGPNAVKFFVDQ